MKAREIQYPIGMQNFPEIISEGYLYVDKTIYIQKLKGKGKYFFLGRPRRFGKSMFLSTLQAYFEGRKELFQGLAISDFEQNWDSHAVIHLDFTGRNYTDPQSLNSRLNSIFDEYEKKYGCPLTDSGPDERFEKIIKHAYEYSGRKVVILVDEYDKPLLDTFKLPQLQNEYRNILRGIYSNLKSMDSYIKFAMLTGVSRFGKLSIFSDTNNLKDISMMEEFAAICGISSDEVNEYLMDGVEALAQKQKWTWDVACSNLKDNYDGYHFSEDCNPDIYNPFSLLNALQDKSIKDYWFETGTPKHLIDLIADRHMKLENIEGLEVSASDLRNVAFNLDNSLIPVLYQSGYLTIKGYDSEVDLLRLGYPNKEVRKSFLLYLMNHYLSENGQKSWTDIVAFYREIRDGKVEDFMQRLKSLYADFNHDGFKFVNLEQHYQDVAYLVFRLLGCLTSVEYKTASGRIDMVVYMSDYIYVFEFKRNGTPQEALAQIDNKNYLIPFRRDGRQLVKIGANFNDDIKSLENWESVF